MIYYKCKVGYSTSPLPSKLESITFLDDAIFSIGTSKSDFTGSGWVSSSEGYNNLYEGIGEDVFTIYNVPPFIGYSSSVGVLADNIFNYIPSIKLGYRNSFEYWQKEHGTLYWISYLPSLQKVIASTGSSSSGFRLGTVIDSNISYSSIFSESFGLDWGTQRIIAGGLNIPNYHGPEDLVNGNLYIWNYTQSSSSVYYSVNLVKMREDSAKYLFGDNPIPDGEGPIPPDNPYEPGGDSGEGGGGGTFDDDSDPIPDSSLPTLSSAATGFTRIYNPTLSQLNQLATYLWTDESIIQTIWNHAKQFFEDPMSVIIGLNIVPVPVPNGGTENFRVLYIDTGIPLTYAASQFVDVDCGTLEIKRYYGSALDQAPYTKISCFLPFIGTVQLNTDEVMGATLQVKYRVDICSGSCVAKIFIDGNCIYQYSGHCAINVPVSSADFSSYVSAAISVAKLAIGAAAGGAMGALVNAGTDPIQQTNNTTTITTTNTERNPATGRQITMGTQTQTIESVQQRPTTMASFSGLTPANISNTVGEIMTAKPHVEHSGSFSGNTGYLGVRRPFVIIERPNMCMPASYQQFNGFPCMITLELAECSGFTRVQQVQLTGMSATNPEQAEILELLKSGVII